jgi:hypothetical protein
MLRSKAALLGIIALALGLSSQTLGLASTTTTLASGGTTTTLAALATTTTLLSVATTTTVVKSQATRPSTGASFNQLMTNLWNAILTNDRKAADSLFFPLSGYLKLKVTASPAYDWRTRLLGLFNIDLATYHRNLTAGKVASLVSISFNPSYAQWIPKGACENNIGFWHMPGPRFVYVQNGVTRSVGVFSLISWHGNWYFIHLGPSPHTSTGGMFYAPARGPGRVGPPGGC